LVPLCWQTILAGFLLFRLFDITKWFGIKRAEHLVGAWGVLIDDILAAILANVIIQIGYYLILGS
jgi:phosphatidylglycerophosphatase A